MRPWDSQNLRHDHSRSENSRPLSIQRAAEYHEAATSRDPYGPIDPGWQSIPGGVWVRDFGSAEGQVLSMGSSGHYWALRPAGTVGDDKIAGGMVGSNTPNSAMVACEEAAQSHGFTARKMTASEVSDFEDWAYDEGKDPNDPATLDSYADSVGYLDDPEATKDAISDHYNRGADGRFAADGGAFTYQNFSPDSQPPMDTGAGNVGTVPVDGVDDAGFADQVNEPMRVPTARKTAASPDWLEYADGSWELYHPTGCKAYVDDEGDQYGWWVEKDDGTTVDDGVGFELDSAQQQAETALEAIAPGPGVQYSAGIKTAAPSWSRWSVDGWDVLFTVDEEYWAELIVYGELGPAGNIGTGALEWQINHDLGGFRSEVVKRSRPGSRYTYAYEAQEEAEKALAEFGQAKTARRKQAGGELVDWADLGDGVRGSRGNYQFKGADGSWYNHTSEGSSVRCGKFNDRLVGIVYDNGSKKCPGCKADVTGLFDGRFASRKQGSMWDSVEPNHKVAGWDWNEKLAGYISEGASNHFACVCGANIEAPGYVTCHCGKIWNASTYQANGGMKLVCREVPNRGAEVVLAGKKKLSYAVGDRVRRKDDYGSGVGRVNGIYQTNDGSQVLLVNWGYGAEEEDILDSHVQLASLKTANGVVRDSDYWGLPVGTPIEPGMKPKGDSGDGDKPEADEATEEKPPKEEKPKLPKLTKEEFDKHVADVDTKVKQAISEGKETNLAYSVNGIPDTYNTQRRGQQRRLLQDLWHKMGAEDIPREGKALMSGGLGGAGKTTVLRNPDLGVDTSQYLTLNADDMKEAMVEAGMTPEIEGVDPMETAALIHEESSFLSTQFAYMAYEQGLNVIWDLTMASPGSVQKRIDEMREVGYDQIDAAFVDIPVEKSVERALGRYERGMEDRRNGKGPGGRYVPPAIIRKNNPTEDSGLNSKNRETFESLREQFDNSVVYDNSVDGRSAQKVNGKGRWASRLYSYILGL